MRHTITLLLFALVLAGCGESAAEKQARLAEEQETRRQVELAIPTDRMSLYLINQAETRCQEYPVPKCGRITTIRQDIADAVASCLGNTSRLCQLMAYPAQHQPEDVAQLPTGNRVMLPSSPFYWSLGNPILDRYASQTGYRAEVGREWLQAHHLALQVVAAALAALLLGGIGKTVHAYYQHKKQEALQRQQQAEEQAKREELARKLAVEQEATRQAAALEAQRMAERQRQQEQARKEAEQRAEAKAREEAAEQERFEAEERAELEAMVHMFRD